jgi:hypothetical protein
MENEKTLVR